MKRRGSNAIHFRILSIVLSKCVLSNRRTTFHNTGRCSNNSIQQHHASFQFDFPLTNLKVRVREKAGEETRKISRNIAFLEMSKSLLISRNIVIAFHTNYQEKADVDAHEFAKKLNYILAQNGHSFTSDYSIIFLIHT